MYKNTNQPTSSANERLLKAADYGDLDGVKKAIEEGASLNQAIQEGEGGLGYNHDGLKKNPLWLAIQGGHEEIAKYILSKCLNIGRVASTLYEAAKTTEMKLLIAEKSNDDLFTQYCDYKTVGSATSGLILRLALRQYSKIFQEFDKKIEDKDHRLDEIQHLLKEQNLEITQIQLKNELIQQQNKIISQLNQTVIELKNELEKLQAKVKSLIEDKTLTIEINDHERQLQELKQEIASLRAQLSKSKFKDNAQNAITIQALTRGFLSRNHHSRISLKEQRKIEIQAKLPEAMARLAALGKYEEMAKLAEALKQDKLHQAMQIIRGKPEQEIAAGNRRIKY